MGQSAQIAADLFTMNNPSMIHVGYFNSTSLSPEVFIDARMTKVGPKPALTLPAEGSVLSFFTRRVKKKS